ncbi:MAG: hypothetical protein LBJ00_12660 [Planctomycetaceae bacterium]|nr:hypothetical protein [Planctomycetaceae bacterium]
MLLVSMMMRVIDGPLALVPFCLAKQSYDRSSLKWELLASGTHEQNMTIRQHLRDIHSSNIMINEEKDCVIVNGADDIVNMIKYQSGSNSSSKFSLYEIDGMSPFDFGAVSDAIVFVLNNNSVTDSFFGSSREFRYDGTLKKMQVISFANANITDKVIPRIVSLLKNCKASLRVINLRNTHVTENGLNIIRSEYPNVLLNPEHNTIPVYPFEAALDGTCLDFGKTGIVSDDMILMLDSIPITHLKLKNMPVTNRIFVSVNTMTELVEIDLQNTKIEGDADVHLLAELPKLQKLNLNETKVSADAIGKLSTSKSITHLIVGTIPKDGQNSVELSPLAKQSLSCSENCTRNNNNISSALVDNHSIRVLSIDGVSICDTILADMVSFKKLQFLTIYNCEMVTDKGLLSLQKSDSIKRIYLRNTGVTKSGLKEFIKLRPKVVVQWWN